MMEDHERAVLLPLLPYVDAALTGVAPVTDDKRCDHLEYADVAGTMLDAPFPGVASVDDLPVSFLALETFDMPAFFDTLNGANG